MKKVFILILALCMGPGGAAFAGDGEVLYEHWDGITGGNEITLLTGNANYPDNPTGSWMLTDGVDGPVGRADNYGARITGFIVPPETANYTFIGSADDRVEVWVSTDANPENVVLVANNVGWSAHNDFADPDLRVLVSDIPLQAGNRYAFYALMKEGTGGDNFSVGWKSDGTVIGSSYVVIAKEYVTTIGFFAATNPNPPDGAAGLSQSDDIKLTWDPGNLAKPIQEYRVYLDTDQANLGTQNALLSTVWKEGDPNIVIPGGSLVPGADVYWRVDAFGDTTKPIEDPNNMTGAIWSFKTIRSYPVIDADPADAIGWMGDTVSFSIQARSGDLDDVDANGQLHYEWMNDDGPIGAPDSPTIDVVVGSGNQNIYCVVSNNSETVAESAPALLFVKKYVAWYTFDEGSGTDVLDTSPAEHRTTATPNDGVLQVSDAAAYWTDEGKIGGALDMHGLNSNTTGQVAVGKTASELGIGGNAARTFSVWVYPRRWNEGAPYEIGNRQTARNWSLRTNGTGFHRMGFWKIQYWGGDRDFWTWKDHGNRIASTRGWHFQTHKTWTHFVHIHDGANTKIYANGILIVDWPKTIDTGDGVPLKIGHWRNREFDGMIDDLQIFNFAMSREEVVDLYVAGEPDATFCQGSDPADLDGDCDVDVDDLKIFAEGYLENGLLP